MSRTQLIISYRGGAYSGWQRQDNALAIQQVVEEGIAQLAGSEAKVVAAGRTDAGVHARAQSAHVEGEFNLPDSAWVGGLNRFLPEDIRIVAAYSRPETFHARFDAAGKEYRYRISTAPVVNALDSWCTVRVGGDLDLERMNEAAAHLIGRHDYAAFALAGSNHHSSVREISQAEWMSDGEVAVFSVVGNGFLRGMVRSIVGTLMECGQGKRDAEDVARLLEKGRREEAGPTAPAKGLILQRVEYRSDSGENNPSSPG